MSIIEQALEKARQEAGAKNVPPPMRGELGLIARPERSERPPRRTVAVMNTNQPGQGEEYRLLKEKLLALRKQDSSMNMFMVTSPMRAEGKTHIACNLAMSLAHEFDHTVLIIDADMRAPSCHRLFGLQRTAGLSDCLLDGKNFRDVLVDTGIGRLSFLSMGNPVSNIAELFSSNLMRDLLQEIKSRYSDRIIILDTPPFLPFAETRLLSRVADGILLVAREGVTLKSHLAASVRAMDKRKLLGVIYNDAANSGADKEIFNLSYTY